MTTLSVIAMLVVIEGGLLLYAASRAGPYLLRGLGIIVNMLAVTLYGPFLINVAGYTTNVGNIFVATAVCSACILLERFGRAAVLFVIPHVYATLLAFVALGAMLHLFPVDIDTPAIAAIRVVTDHSLRTLAASFSAFFLSMVIVLMPMWALLRPRFGPVATAAIASYVVHVVDTPAFFIPAFWDVLPATVLVEAMIAGLAFKLIVMVALLPVFAVALWLVPVDTCPASQRAYEAAAGSA